MTITHTLLDENAENYLLASSQHENNDLFEVFTSAYSFPEPFMQISRLQATALQFFITAFNINSVLEIGTFVGYSAFCMAKMLDHNTGSITTIEINSKFHEQAETNQYNYTKKNKNSLCTKSIGKINFVNADAKEYCVSHPTIGNKIDMLFLDGDKENYSFYLEWAIKNMKSGSYFIVDNALFKGGAVTNSGKYGTAIRKMTQELKSSNLFDYFFLPVGDCMLVAKKK